MTSDTIPCPACAAPPGCLHITFRLVCAPLGTFSLAGNAAKASARLRPVLTCDRCPLYVVGDLDDDGRHVTFPRPAA